MQIFKKEQSQESQAKSTACFPAILKSYKSELRINETVEVFGILSIATPPKGQSMETEREEF